MEPADAAGPAPQSRDASWWLVVAGLAAAGLGLLLPWADVGFVSVDGFSTDDGKIFAVLLTVAAFLAWRVLSGAGDRRALVALTVLAALLVAFALYEIVDIESIEAVIVEPSAGSGLYLDLLGSAAVVAGGVMRLRRPSPA